MQTRFKQPKRCNDTTRKPHSHNIWTKPITEQNGLETNSGDLSNGKGDDANALATTSILTSAVRGKGVDRLGMVPGDSSTGGCEELKREGLGGV
jgi:hypothetical protein